jgi:hypothetical protein
MHLEIRLGLFMILTILNTYQSTQYFRMRKYIGYICWHHFSWSVCLLDQEEACQSRLEQAPGFTSIS